MPSPPPAPDLLRFATCALQLHHHTALPEHDRPADRAELDALHAHTAALFALLDARTTATSGLLPATGLHLHAARVRLWQATEHLHAAYHATPRPDRRAGDSDSPEPAARLTACQRHLAVGVRVRQVVTPTELRNGPCRP